MPIRMLENPYRGINAHLHSMAQNPGDSPTIWTSIHASHIAHITDFLNQQLPAEYIARTEQSLQIWTEEYDRGLRYLEHALPMMYAGAENANASAYLDALVDHEGISIPSVVIYRPRGHRLMGEPVTRIEMLSETNKVRSSECDKYLEKRSLALRSGTSLIELDYLHQTASPLKGVPKYPDDEDARPYSIALSDRRPQQPPITQMYEFYVDAPIPSPLLLPLLGEDAISFDFNAVYQHTFRIGRWGVHIDYAIAPEALDTYRAGDQERIHALLTRLHDQQKENPHE